MILISKRLPIISEFNLFLCGTMRTLKIDLWDRLSENMKQYILKQIIEKAKKKISSKVFQSAAQKKTKKVK